MVSISADDDDVELVPADDDVVDDEILDSSPATYPAAPPRGGGPPSGWRHYLISDAEIASLKFVFSCNYGPNNTPRYWLPDKKTVHVYLRAYVGLFAGAMMWVGIWDLLSDEERMSGQVEHVMSWKKDAKEAVGYIFAGSAIIVLTDTYYAGCGMDTPFRPREGVIPAWMRWWQRGFVWGSRAAWDKWNRRVRYTVRCILAWFGMVMQWVGVYNLLENEIFPHTNWTDPESVQQRLHVDWGYLICGMLILVVTNTFYNMATVFPPEVETGRVVQTFKKPDCTTTWASIPMGVKWWVFNEGGPFIRCFCSVVAQNMIWVGLYGLQENHWFGGANAFSLKRDIGYCLFGIGGMIVTNSVTSNSFIEYSDLGWDQPIYGTPIADRRHKSHRTVLFGVRVTVALLSQVVWWNGIWGVLDSHLAGSTNSSWAATHLDNYWERNVIYILVAAVLLRLCNALYSSCGVIPYALIKGVEMDAVTGLPIDGEGKPDSPTPSETGGAGDDDDDQFDGDAPETTVPHLIGAGL